MIEFGKTLREAREAKGYSVSQLAEITHILPQIIENLEKEDFTKIVAPIYGRGFVKLYCETVGIDAKPLITEFMEIYNGNRQPALRLMEVELEDSALEPQPSENPPVPQEPNAVPPEDAPRQPIPEPATFDFSKPVEHEESLDEPPQPQSPQTAFSTEPDEPFFGDEPGDVEKRRYHLPAHSMPEVPRSFWRFGILVTAAAIVIVLLVLGARALYRATMNAPEAESAMASGDADEKAKAAQKPQTPSPQPANPRAPRKGVAVPPLYID